MKIPDVLRIEPLFDEYDILAEVAHKDYVDLLAITDKIKQMKGVVGLRILSRTRFEYLSSSSQK